MAPGIFTLKTPEDLYAKLQKDYLRMCKNTIDPDACFDFFVTANHLAEWYSCANSKTAAEFRKKHAALRVCEHLATSAKHYEVTNCRIHSITSTHTSSIVSIPTVDVKSAALDKSGNPEGFFVNLESKEATELGASIAAIDLAKTIVELWKKELRL